MKNCKRRAASDPFHKESSALTRGSPGTQRAPERGRGRSWRRRSRHPCGCAERRRTNLDTPSRPRGRSRVRMLLSFQRPSHLFRKVPPSQQAHPRTFRPRSGPTSIAPNRRSGWASISWSDRDRTTRRAESNPAGIGVSPARIGWQFAGGFPRRTCPTDTVEWEPRLGAGDRFDFTTAPGP